MAFTRYVEKYGAIEQANDDNMAHAHCILDNQGYKHTLTICNNHCFYATTMVARSFLIVTLVHALSVLSSYTGYGKKTCRFLIYNKMKIIPPFT